MRLPDPQRSCAVLIGIGTYRSAEIADLPAVANNLDGLARILTDPAMGGFLADRCTVLSDPADARAVYYALRRYAELAEDTLLVYFAGHGMTAPVRNELYLALTDTQPDALRVSALPFDLIREVLSEAQAVNRVVILDCCFSGRVTQEFMSGADQAILGQLDIEGTYILASAPATSVALAPTGATYTAFTGELLTLLRTGVPSGPELLTFATIYRRLLRTMNARGLPAPEQRGTGTVDQLALTRNASYASRSGSAPPRQPQPQRLQVPGKKGAAAFGFLISVLSAIFSAMVLILLLISYPWDPGETTGAVIAILVLIILVLGLPIVAVSSGSTLFRPFEFRVDGEGFEFTRAGRRVCYSWTEVDRISVSGALSQISATPKGVWAEFWEGVNIGAWVFGPLMVLYVRLLPGTTQPQFGAPPLYPRLQRSTGRVLLCEVHDLKIDQASLYRALTQFAGPRWEPPPETNTNRRPGTG